MQVELYHSITIQDHPNTYYHMANKWIMCALLVCMTATLPAQTAPQKNLPATRITESVKIDGVLDDVPWSIAPAADGFTQYGPNPGEPGSQKTESYILYDDNFIYIGARLYDTHPDSILKEMTERDNFGNTDYFGIIIDAYQSGVNGTGFFVTPKGIQLDLVYTANSGGGSSIVYWGDRNWDGVWEAETQIDENGWTVEMQIPYSALRFPTQAEQDWNVNIVRSIRRTREELFWNKVDPAIEGLINQMGTLEELTDIKAPLRLSATPFIAGYIQNVHDESATPVNNWGRSFNAGMDIKYGINDAFTLDMTLIPDFGEARSDNQVLNLSPFEVRFDENRQFFTEGVELFNKGNLFYSRRVGGRPLNYWDAYDAVGEGDSLLINPQQTQLINASKVSGRTDKGLGVGVFNAVSSRTVAQIYNEESGETREFETSPLTNYNVVVFDQNLKNNSFVTLINTNVWRNGSDYDANVTGALFYLRNKKNSYAIGGQGVLTQLYHPEEVDLGHKAALNVEKTSGNLRFWLGYNEESDTYNPNDLGFLFNNNERSFNANVRYNIFEPFGPFNEGGIGFWNGYTRLYNPNVFTSYRTNFWAWLVTRKFFAFGVFSNASPVETYNYFEPRVEGRYYTNPTSFNIGNWFSTDYRKKFAFDFEWNARWFSQEGRRNLNFDIGPRYRFSDQFTLRWNVGIYNAFRTEGWAEGISDEEIIFGVRDQQTVVNSINSNFTFTKNMVLTFRLRHYWSRVKYHSFHELMQDGSLGDTNYNEFEDNSFNSFNIDAIYRWRFAPGSDIFVVWKNSILDFANESHLVAYSYRDGARQLFDLPQTNSLSMKIIYWLDYQALVN